MLSFYLIVCTVSRRLKQTTNNNYNYYPKCNDNVRNVTSHTISIQVYNYFSLSQLHHNAVHNYQRPGVVTNVIGKSRKFNFMAL